MKSYNKYGLAAKQATEIGENPVDSWEQAVSKYFTSESSKQKACPRNAF